MCQEPLDPKLRQGAAKDGLSWRILQQLTVVAKLPLQVCDERVQKVEFPFALKTLSLKITMFCTDYVFNRRQNKPLRLTSIFFNFAAPCLNLEKHTKG